MTKKDFKVIADALKKASLETFYLLVWDHPENQPIVLAVLNEINIQVILALRKSYLNFDENKFTEYLFNMSEFNEKYPEAKGLEKSKGRRNKNKK